MFASFQPPYFVFRDSLQSQPVFPQFPPFMGPQTQATSPFPWPTGGAPGTSSTRPSVMFGWTPSYWTPESLDQAYRSLHPETGNGAGGSGSGAGDDEDDANMGRF